MSYDNWKTTPPEPEVPDCPVCGAEMECIPDGASVLWICVVEGCPGRYGDGWEDDPRDRLGEY